MGVREIIAVLFAVTRHCKQVDLPPVTSVEDHDVDADEDLSEKAQHYSAVNLTPDGINFSYSRDTFSQYVESTIVYAELRGILKPQFIPKKTKP